MHDPKVIAFDIRRPWPQVRKVPKGDRRGNRPFSWPFASFAGRELYWPAIITVWHVEPGGADALTVCDDRSLWQWHVHHWRIQVQPLQHLRRSLLTRCVHCGGRSVKGNQVNVSHSWHGERAPWWRGEVGLYHHACSAIVSRRDREEYERRNSKLDGTPRGRSSQSSDSETGDQR